MALYKLYSLSKSKDRGVMSPSYVIAVAFTIFFIILLNSIESSTSADMVEDIYLFLVIFSVLLIYAHYNNYTKMRA